MVGGTCEGGRRLETGGFRVIASRSKDANKYGICKYVGKGISSR